MTVVGLSYKLLCKKPCGIKKNSIDLLGSKKGNYTIMIFSIYRTLLRLMCLKKELFFLSDLHVC